MIDKKERIKRTVLIIIIVVIACVSMIVARDRRMKKAQEKEKIEEKEKPKEQKQDEKEDNNVTLIGEYNIDIIKAFDETVNKTNYLISPYNIEIGLNMLRDGADGKTKEELDKVLGNRVITDISVKDKIGIANGVFIKDVYKNNVKNDYYNILNDKYKSEIIYDSFTTPDKINNWVNEKTNGMIPKILDQISKDYVMGLASALAIDVKWQYQFDCDMTKSEEFTKIDNSKINVEMMHNTYETDQYKYIKNDDVEGVIIPYQKEQDSNIELEFIGLLPNDGIDKFINNLTSEKINTIINSSKPASKDININLSLPRFKYDYQPNDFIKILKSLGIKEAFDPDNANFRKMIEIESYNVYVGEAIHKTHIELNEIGTKAAAVTYFGMYKNSVIVPNNPEVVNINFNKPFIYMIREKNTSELLFFGVVYEPNIWKKTTCDNK